LRMSNDELRFALVELKIVTPNSTIGK
jgi:hypothetical protein